MGALAGSAIALYELLRKARVVESNPSRGYARHASVVFELVLSHDGAGETAYRAGPIGRTDVADATAKALLITLVKGISNAAPRLIESLLPKAF